MTPPDDDVVTFAGAAEANRRAWAAATPTQRIEWLEQAQEIALASGAFEREIARRAWAQAGDWPSLNGLTAPPGDPGT
jgi:hypothetical protein